MKIDHKKEIKRQNFSAKVSSAKPIMPIIPEQSSPLNPSSHSQVLFWALHFPWTQTTSQEPMSSLGVQTWKKLEIILCKIANCVVCKKGGILKTTWILT